MAHWYDRNTGHLLPDVELKTKPGVYREANLADARKVQALPSVTTMIQLLNRPGLTKWQVEQGIKAAFESDRTDVATAYTKSQEYTRWTADFGTAVHEWMSYKLRGVIPIIPPIMPHSEEVADGILLYMEHNGYVVERSEYHVARPDLGVAGTPDIIGTHRGKPCIVDVKTQEPPLTPYDPDHPLQLAGYSALCDLDPDVERISLIANRLNAGEVHAHLWVDKHSTVRDTNSRYDNMWSQLSQLWFAVNKYDPRG